MTGTVGTESEHETVTAELDRGKLKHCAASFDNKILIAGKEIRRTKYFILYFYMTIITSILKL